MICTGETYKNVVKIFVTGAVPAADAAELANRMPAQAVPDREPLRAEVLAL
jgi:hypothetical protein